MTSNSPVNGSVKCAIAPWLSVRKSAQAVEFYKSAFGAAEVFRLEDEVGGVVARLSVDGGEFWISDESPEHKNFSPETLGGGTVRMILTVADPDAVFTRAVQAGAAPVSPVSEEHGWRSDGWLILTDIIGRLAGCRESAISYQLSAFSNLQSAFFKSALVFCLVLRDTHFHDLFSSAVGKGLSRGIAACLWKCGRARVLLKALNTSMFAGNRLQ